MLDIVSKISTRKENILMKRVDRYNISKPKKVYFILLITLNSYSFNTEYVRKIMISKEEHMSFISKARVGLLDI